MKKKALLAIKILFLLLLVYYFHKFINTEEFFNVFKKIELKEIIFLIIIYFIHFFLITLRWVFVIEKFVKKNFFFFFKNVTLGYNIALFSSTLAIDATKYVGLSNKISPSKNLALVLYDKFFTLFFKLNFLILVFNYFNFTNLKFYEITLFLISVIVIIVLFIFILKINFFLNFLNRFKHMKIFNNLNEVIQINKKKIFKLIAINFAVQFQNIILYFYCINIFIEDISFLNVSLITPLIEIIGVLQVFLIGLIEFSTVLLYDLFDLNNVDILAASLTLKFCELVVFITILFLTFFNFSLKKIKYIKKK